MKRSLHEVSADTSPERRNPRHPSAHFVPVYQRWGAAQPSGSHERPPPGSRRTFEHVALTDNAQAIFGDVYTSCADVMQHLTVEQEIQSLVKRLCYQGMNDRIAQIPLADSETCEWIWSTKFGQWLGNPESDEIFWISGKPGSGKSTLMKYIAISERALQTLPALLPPQKWKLVHFFFDFRAAERMANTGDGMLRSILHQVLQDMHLPKDTLAQHGLDLERLFVTNQLSSAITALGKLLRSERVEILLLIDGLDECGSDISNAVRSIKNINANTDIRVCVASRPDPLIRALLADCPGVKVQECNGVGMQRYARSAFDAITVEIGLLFPPNHHFIEELLRRAEGVFLWFRLAIETVVQRMVQGFDEPEIRTELSLLPKNLNHMYQRIFDRVPEVCRSEVALILQLLDYAKHKIDLVSLFSAWLILMRQVKSERSVPNITSVAMFRVRLEGFLGGLIDIHKNASSTESGSLVQSKGKTFQGYGDTLISAHTSANSHTYDTIEVRMSHETLRAYLRDTGLLTKWMSHEMLKQVDRHIWADLHCWIIAKAERRLGSRMWRTIEKVCEDTREVRNTAADLGKNFLGVHLVLDEMIVAFKTSQTDADFMPSDILAEALAHSIIHLFSTIQDVSPGQQVAFKKVTMILTSPLLLLHDLLRTFSPRYVDFMLAKICTHGRAWRHDLAFASARCWATYLGAHTSALRNTSAREKDYIFSCGFVRATVAWSKGPIEPSIVYVDGLRKRLYHLVTDNKHIAIRLCAQNRGRVMFTALERESELYRHKDSSVHVSDLDCYQIRYFAGRDIVDLWVSSKVDSETTLEECLRVMKEKGVDLSSWRSSSNEKIGQAILTSVQKQDLIEFGPMKAKTLIRLDLGSGLLDPAGIRAAIHAWEQFHPYNKKLASTTKSQAFFTRLWESVMRGMVHAEGADILPPSDED